MLTVKKQTQQRAAQTPDSQKWGHVQHTVTQYKFMFLCFYVFIVNSYEWRFTSAQRTQERGNGERGERERRKEGERERDGRERGERGATEIQKTPVRPHQQINSLVHRAPALAMDTLTCFIENNYTSYLSFL